MTDAKHCSSCSAVKPLADFYRHRRYSDGVRTECKVCTARSNRSSESKLRDQRRADLECAKCGAPSEPYLCSRCAATAAAADGRGAEYYRELRAAKRERVECSERGCPWPIFRGGRCAVHYRAALERNRRSRATIAKSTR